MTVLLTTHYLEEADQLADRLAIIDSGRLVVEGTPDELKSELRGDTVHVELSSPDAAAAALGLLTHLRACTRSMRTAAACGPVPSTVPERFRPSSPPSRTQASRRRRWPLRVPRWTTSTLRHVGRSFEVAA